MWESHHGATARRFPPSGASSPGLGVRLPRPRRGSVEKARAAAEIYGSRAGRGERERERRGEEEDTGGEGG